MKTNAACLLIAALASGAAMAQTNANQPLNGQVRSQLNTQLNPQLNSQVNTGSAATPGLAGNGLTRGKTLPPATPLRQPGATIGTPGVTAPLSTIDNRPAMTGLGTTGISNSSGSSLSPGVTGASTVNDAGTWGTASPNNMPSTPAPATPNSLALPGSAPAGSPTAPVGR